MDDGRDFERIEKAIHYLHSRATDQPSLDDVAAHVHLSPHHFQRLFSRWAGVSPKKFLQFLSIERAKRLLAGNGGSLEQVAWNAGLSGSGRLHDLFINIEAMTPGEYRNGGTGLALDHQFYPSPFGGLRVAATARGICHMQFANDPSQGLDELRRQFPGARLQQRSNQHLRNVERFFQRQRLETKALHVHLRGTAFQLKVWQSLLSISPGELTSYGRIAESIQRPSAARAVGSAVGQNPIAILIPCHRVIQASGHFGRYRWGSDRKLAMIGWEAAQGWAYAPPANSE